MSFGIREHVLLAVVLTSTSAQAITERQHQERLCAGMILEWKLPAGRGYVDCRSTEYAIEVEWLHKWHGSIGQAMWYAWETDLKPAVILVCKRSKGPCTRHFGLFRKTLSEWNLPVSSWYCEEAARTLDECRFYGR